VIIRGGENLFPATIENVVTQHPSVQGAAAIAVPDATFGLGPVSYDRIWSY